MELKEKKLLTIQEVADEYGGSVSWWRSAVAGRSGKSLPDGVVAVKIGNSWRISRVTLDIWISSSQATSASRRRGRPRKTAQASKGEE